MRIAIGHRAFIAGKHGAVIHMIDHKTGQIVKKAFAKGAVVNVIGGVVSFLEHQVLGGLLSEL